MKPTLEIAQQRLEKIEYKNRTWKSKFIREQCIWDEIAENICGTKGDELDLWCLVMELYHKKYSNNQN